MEHDFELVLLLYYAEIAVADVPDKVCKLRLSALGELRWYLNHYRKLGYLQKLLCGIAAKKCERIKTATTATEMYQILKPRCPRYNGNRFLPDEYSVPEEELICWSKASLRAPLNEVGCNRFMELFKQVLPEESKLLSL